MKTITVLLVVAAAAAAAGGGTAAAGQAPAAGNVENGRMLYEKQTCYYCHGTAGQGGRDGARVAATALTVRQFIRYVRQPTGAMPAFTDKLLSDQQLADIQAYLKTLPEAKAPRDIPLLAQMQR
jgi:mono/diheme cytochrome c family protein